MSVYLYNPENFSPLEVLPKNLHKFADDARYFVHKLYVGRVFNKRNKQQFQPLKAEYLRRVMSERKYPFIRKALLDSGTILSDYYWIRGKKAIGYMLAPHLNESRHQRVKITNQRLIRNIIKHTGKLIKSVELDVHVHLWKILNEITVNYDEAIQDIDEDFHIHELAIAMIRDGEWFFNADKYGRVHTNITNLKSKLRKHLCWKEQKLVNIDITNSQPFFFGILLLDYYSNDKYFSPSFNNIPPLYHLRCDILPSDALLFVDLVKKGTLYEYIANNVGKTIENRKKFKQKLFREIFFCKNNSWETDYSHLFSSLFPNVYTVIKEIKRKDYTLLAKLLQRVESSFVINGVIRRCMDEYPEMPVITIHDSIMTTKLWVEQLKGLVLSEFEQFGMIPRLRIEEYV